jgi:transposase
MDPNRHSPFWLEPIGGLMGGGQKGTRIVTLKDGRTRQFRSVLERRQIVEETLKAGASIALIARAHDVNTNQVFKWRRQYKQGRLEIERPTAALVPVQISNTIPATPVASHRKSRRKRSGIIDIDLGHARVRIEGTVDPDCVKAALEGLIR